MSTETLPAVNKQALPKDEESIANAISLACQIGMAHVQRMKDWAGGTKGKKVLEIGPGSNFASALIMLAFGARAPLTILDPWLVPWDPEHHSAVYNGVADWLEKNHPEADTKFLRQVSREGHDKTKLLRTVESSAEDLSAFEDQEFDCVVSNAVLEHVPGIERAFDEMHRVTKIGGHGLHAVDLRDHRNFDEPLEYLLLSKEEEEEWNRYTEFHVGSLRRKPVYDRAVQNSGYKLLSDWVTCRAEPEYLESFVPRLRSAQGARYQDYPADELEILGVLYILERVR